MYTYKGGQFVHDDHDDRCRDEMDEWHVAVGNLVARCKAACLWLVDFLSSEEGAANFK